MLFSTSLFLVMVLLVRLIESNEKVFRAFIPGGKVKWFDEKIKETPEIDVWLSIRRLHRPLLNYKYFSEFKLRYNTLHDLETLTELLRNNQIRLEVLVDDLNERPDRLLREKRLVGRVNNRRNVRSVYKSFNQIKSWMMGLARKHPELVKVFKIGTTFENRPILILKLTDLPRKNTQKPLFLFESGIHAREWLSIATNTFFIDRLVQKFLDNDETVVKILKKFELHFIPVMNPDGYEFSRTSRHNRFWRKNMSYSKSTSSEFSCCGVDLNRNFDFKWMVSGASANPCSEIYAGPHPSSESEVKAVMNYIMSQSPRWLSYISLHSYGGIWLAPFSYSRNHIHENFIETCQKAMTAIKTIKAKHGFEYSFGSASHELYEASGCGEDWAKEVAKVNHTFVIELKPESIEYPQTGFEFPESEVEQAALEVYDGFVEYIRSFLVHRVDPEVVRECRDRLVKIEERLSESKMYADYSNEYDYY